jgi:hypothetical protein
MRYLREPSVETAPLQNEIVLLNPGGNKFCMLNKTASFIWNEVGTPKSTKEIAHQLAVAFNGVGPEEALTDVKVTLEQLSTMGFVAADANEKPYKSNVAKKASKNVSERPQYERPKVQSLSEEEILSAFQVVQAGGSGWWVP